MRAARTLLAVLAALTVSILAAAPPAIAAPDDPFVLVDTFDGSTTPDGSFDAGGLVVNQATGRVLVFDKAHSSILQFSAAGVPVDFTALGSPKLQLSSEGKLYIDNSGGASQGNIYVVHPNVSVEGFAPSGAKLAGWPVTPTLSLGDFQSIAVDSTGGVWFSYLGSAVLEEHAPDGTLTGAKIKGTEKEPINPVYFAFDSHDNLIYSPGSEIYVRYPSDGYTKRNQVADKDPIAIAIDPSTDDIYVGHGLKQSITATRFSEPFIRQNTFETLPGLNLQGFGFSGDGQTLFSAEGSKVLILKRQPPEPPETIGSLRYFEVKSRGAFISGDIDTGGGGVTTYRFEYATEADYQPGVYTNVYPVPDYPAPHTNFVKETFNGFFDGFEPLTTYHLRVVVTNVSGTFYGPDSIVRTLAAGDSGQAEEECGNQLARKQTGATGLPDCRAYELVSAAYTGGYDVEAPMVPDQTPFAGFPAAAGFEENANDSDEQRLNRVLYGVHEGVIPGDWEPTNRGVDPYVAVRDQGAERWETEYKGLPANQSPIKASFSSQLGGTDSGLRTFAFAGEDLCFPCFATGFDTGIPLRQPDGDLVQGLDETQGAPDTARPEGDVANMLSPDGTRLVFGSKYQFAAGGNDDNGNLTIYSRDLGTGETEVVSTDPSGDALEVGDDVSQVGISSDGSRILIADRVSEDADGNEYARLYMHRDGSPNSVELTPGFAQGALFAGMTKDGSKVFFTSREKLLGSDTDTAADLYEAAIGPSGSATLSLLTPAVAGACNPVANEAGVHWNRVDGVADCGAVAIGGGSGVASGSGTSYVLSPEKLDGSGVSDEPNLFEIPAGGSPEYITTLSADDPVVLGSVHAASASETGEFQTTPTGEFATFRSTELLTGIDNAGDPSVFLYDAGGAEPVICVSCNQSLTEDPTLKGEAGLAKAGLSITDDGRVFFTTPAALSVEDNNAKGDIYEWVGGRPRLISSGVGRFDSELLTITPNGLDAFFFTHDVLDTFADENGDRTKIYDARTGGGFFKLPVKPECAASDECHGPGTVAPGPPQIGSSGATSDGNARTLKCPKGKVKRKGKCVKKPRKNKGKKSKKSKKGSGRNG